MNLHMIPVQGPGPSSLYGFNARTCAAQVSAAKFLLTSPCMYIRVYLCVLETAGIRVNLRYKLMH